MAKLEKNKGSKKDKAEKKDKENSKKVVITEENESQLFKTILEKIVKVEKSLNAMEEKLDIILGETESDKYASLTEVYNELLEIGEKLEDWNEQDGLVERLGQVLKMLKEVFLKAYLNR